MKQVIDQAKRLIDEKMKKYPKRLAHCYGVAKTARKLAVIHHVNPDRLEVAGLMHDYAKYDSMKSQKKHVDEQLIKKYKDYPVIFHAYAAAYAIEKKLDIHDEAILSPVRCHVWGKPHMTTGEKILFVADYCEPTRTFKDRDYIFELASKHLDEAVLYCMKSSMKDLKKRDLKPSKASKEAYQYYKEELRGSTTKNYSNT